MDSPIAALSERSQPSLRVRRAKTAAIPAKPLKLLPLPRWVMQAVPRAGGEPLGEPSAGVILSSEVRAGAALFALDEIVRTDPAWLGALRMRLALLATIATARLVRISADEAGLRDAEYLTRPGDDPGPAGRLHRLWRRVAARPAGMAAEIIEALADEVGLKGSTGERAAEVVGLMQADVDLALLLGWKQPIPLSATVIADPLWREGRERRVFFVNGEGWEARRMAVFGLAALRAHAVAVDLARRADLVTASAETLRTRDGGGGLRLILSDDCVAPWRMAGPGRGQVGCLGSDRAARRFCESLHAKGTLRLLTDRPTFRLYGL